MRVWWLQRSPQVLCAQPVCSWATRTHCELSHFDSQTNSGLTCGACCLQPVDTGLISTYQQSKRLNLSATLL